MSVQPVARGPIIERGLYEMIDRRLYDQTDAPPTIRLTLDGGPRLQPVPENGVPTDVLGVPETMLDASNVHPSADTARVFLLKPHAAYRVSRQHDPHLTGDHRE